jgi:hypothetical protein
MVARVFRRAFAICSNRSFLLSAIVVFVVLAIAQRSVASPYPASTSISWA